jgi:hypothetical protein
MASTKSQKYIIPDYGKAILDEGLKHLKKIYNVLVKLNKTGLRKVQYITLNKGIETEFKIQVIFTTSLSPDGLYNVCGEYAIQDDKISPYSIAVLEYVSKYLSKLCKKDPDITLLRGCNVCEKKSQTCKKCACRTIYYCSTDCQKADWNRHKTMCKPITSK